MNKEQKVEAFKMRMDGYTYDSIAKKFNVSKQYVQAELSRSLKRKSNVKYPKLQEWLEINNISNKKFCEIIGSNANVYNAMSVIRKSRMSGETGFKIDEIKKILEYTGMTFEELFKESGIDDIRLDEEGE